MCLCDVCNCIGLQISQTSPLCLYMWKFIDMVYLQSQTPRSEYFGKHVPLLLLASVWFAERDTIHDKQLCYVISPKCCHCVSYITYGGCYIVYEGMWNWSMDGSSSRLLPAELRLIRWRGSAEDTWDVGWRVEAMWETWSSDLQLPPWFVCYCISYRVRDCRVIIADVKLSYWSG